MGGVVTARDDPDQREEQAEDEKQEYSPPLLIELGSYEELTQGAGCSNADGGCAIS
jgi:hypothetical protein